jgi:hypothetical protein
MAVAALLVGSFAGGSYLEGRLSAAEQDGQGRLQHWSRSLALAKRDAAPWWGIGIGRFAAHFAFSGETTDQVGEHRWRGTPDGGELVLTAGKHVLGSGQLFRMSQRIPAPLGPVTVRWRVFVEQPSTLDLDLCNKHLLYEGDCSVQQVRLGQPVQAAASTGWEEGQVVLPAGPTWRAPVFSISVGSRGTRLRIDRLEAVDATGRDLLHNGGFDEGLARWLPSSDRHHLPWHAKNLALHLRVEQGWLGLGAFVVLLGFAVARLTLGRARRHPLAPPLLAGIVGFLVVGAFDSLLDIPRVAFAFLWLLGVAATLRAPVMPPGRP